ncbi:MAG: hypothetical protein HOP26_09485 [Methylotenera sp.]|nr:hypothetical protein [Methylotenera sp.]
MTTLMPQQRIEVSIDKVPVTQMNAEQIAQLHTKVDETLALQLPQLHNAQDPHSRLFVMALDGTQNDAINDPLHATNVGLIDVSIQKQSAARKDILSKYEPGVGNQKLIAGVVDSVTGFTVSKQATDAYTEFVETANQWHLEDPNVKISMAGIGFSRGASALMIASNMVHEKGIPDLSSRVSREITNPITGKTETETTYSRYIVPPGQVPQALILNDQVATGKAEDMDRRIAPSVVSVVQLQAKNEHRTPFPFYSAEDPTQPDPRLYTLKISGAHSDIGGGYLLNGISSVTRQINEIVLNKYGANIPESTAEINHKKYVIHDSEYLWGDRNAGSPTPPLETSAGRKVIFDKGPGDGIANPVADELLLQKYIPRIDATPMKQDMPVSFFSGFTQAQMAVVVAHMQENLAINHSEIMAASQERIS